VERERPRARPAGRAPRLSNPDVTVAAVIERGGRFLIVEERIGQRLLLNQPAGHVELDETLLAAVAREVNEESAWRFAPRALVGVYQWRNPARRRSFLRFAFCGEVTGHNPAQRLDHGIVTTHWLTAEELRAQPERLRSPLVLRCIEDYLAGNRADPAAVGALDRDAARAVPALRL
jgi:8-oxo-dGTP pyrophosphatase MutT (NUDIX family)